MVTILEPVHTLFLDIEPVAAPRMTKRDKWKKRDSVLRYFAFRDYVRLVMPEGFDINDCSIRFVVPMPQSWSKKKRAAHNGMAHTSRPDLDNFLKGLLDAIYGEDSHIHSLARVDKIWGERGYIVIRRNQ